MRVPVIVLSENSPERFITFLLTDSRELSLNAAAAF